MEFFAYGTLVNQTYLKAICGGKFEFSYAKLKGYKKYSPQSGYPYIMERAGSEVEGVLYYGLDRSQFSKIDKYESEGNIYSREKVKVLTEEGKEIETYTYVGNIHNLRRTFGDHINVNILNRVEGYLEEKFGERVKLIYKDNDNEAPMDKEKQKENLSMKAKKELLGADIKNLINQCFESHYVTNYEADTELKYKGLPNLPNTEDMPLRTYQSYLTLSFNVLVLNQLEDEIVKNYGNIIYSPYPLYERTLSLLTALRFLNTHLYELLVYREGFFKDVSLESLSYLDLTKKAVITAREFFLSHKEEIRLVATEIRRNLNSGALSIGVEMEFSNLGYRTLKKNVSMKKDKDFCGFLYFNEFDMLRRLWKLGGHIDDHKLSEQNEKVGGFLEFAVGREGVYSKKSSPLTKSMYVANEFIRNLILFCNIKPHSLHINIQNTNPIDWNKENDVELLKCLILLAGDFRKTAKGNILEKRIFNKELVKDPNGALRFISENKHYQHGDTEFTVIEYQFPRLSMTRDYETLLAAFKGFQVAYNPRPFGSKLRVLKGAFIKNESKALEKWALDVKPVSAATIEAFLSYVSKGLFTENKGYVAHKKRYIDELLFKIEKELKSVNESISNPITFMRWDQEIPYEKLARKFLIS